MFSNVFWMSYTFMNRLNLGLSLTYSLDFYEWKIEEEILSSSSFDKEINCSLYTKKEKCIH